MSDDVIYPDSSVVVSLYLNDAHHEQVVRRASKVRRMRLTPLHRAEWTHAVAQHVYRREFSAAEARQFHATFEQNRATEFWWHTLFPEGALERSERLAQKWVPTLGGRTLDTLHVASALELGCKRFWTLDTRQAKLAKAAGLALF